MRLFIKTYPNCPMATAINVVTNILWTVLFFCLFYYGVIPQTGSPMVFGIIMWGIGSFVISGLTDLMADKY